MTFLLWSVLQSVTDIAKTHSGWNKIMSASLWWSEVRLKQLVAHNVTKHVIDPPIVSQSLGRNNTVLASGFKKHNEHVLSLGLTRQIMKTDTGRKHAHFVAWAHTPSIFQECRDYRRKQCRDQASDQELDANQNVVRIGNILHFDPLTRLHKPATNHTSNWQKCVSALFVASRSVSF